MNALNILSGKSPSINPTRSRTSSATDIALLADIPPEVQQESGGAEPSAQYGSEKVHETIEAQDEASRAGEETPLLQDQKAADTGVSRSPSSWRLVPKRIADVITTSMWAVVSTVTAPIQYVVACFYDEDGTFSALLPIRRIYHVSSRKKRRRSGVAMGSGSPVAQEDDGHDEKPRLRPKSVENENTAFSTGNDRRRSSHSEASSDPQNEEIKGGPAQNTRSKTTSQEEIAPAKRSIRIKLHNDAAQQRRHRSNRSIDGTATDEDRVTAVANSLKSPSSATVATKLKYPRAPAPPRPLVPRRQPSYSNSFNPEAPKKTLVIDLDETLIHSMAKGNRMSTGHMVEVKFQGPIGGNGVVLGPQVPILYFVHERPHCHEFLRKVSKWYNLIAFTASVQEYADPVVDWLERERKYFSGRYYRQHCTFRNGAYIKDLSQVEPDLSKVMILDNSPMSYIFHEDNAIPIEGWISDPTDNDLLHLIPFLEGLQYATDVRALLALRLGQAERA